MADENALPDLKAKLRLDTSESAGGIADIKSAIASLGADMRAAAEANARAQAEATAAYRAEVESVRVLQAEERTRSAEAKAEQAARAQASAAEKKQLAEAIALQKERTATIRDTIKATIEQGSAMAAAGPTGGIGMGTGLLAGALGLGAVYEAVKGFHDMSEAAASYSAEIERQSELLGVNTGELQALDHAAQAIGLSTDQVTSGIVKFQRSIETGAPTLKALGLSLGDLGITSTDTTTALAQFSEALQRIPDAAERNSIALALMGRGATGLSEILAKGPDWLKRYEEELKSYGLILDDSALKTGALAATIDKQFTMAAQGVKLQVGTQLEGAFSALELTVIKSLGGADEAFKRIGDAIAGVVGGIASLLQGLFGITINFSDFNSALHSASAELQGMGQGADTSATALDNTKTEATQAKAALDALKQSTTDQVQAIDAQVKALQDQEKAQLAAMTAAEKAAAEQTADQTKGIDAQIKAAHDWETSEQERIRMTQLLQQQQDEQHQSYLSQLQDELTAMTSVTDGQRRSGESLLAYARRMQQDDVKDKITAEQAKRKEQGTSDQIYLESLKVKTQAEAAALDAQKTLLQDGLKAWQDSMAEQRTMLQDHTAEVVQNLQDQKTALQQHLQDETQAYSDAQNSIKAGYTATANAVAATTSASVDGVKAGLTSLNVHANNVMQQLGETIRNWFQHPEAILGDVYTFGKVVGEAMLGGIGDAIKNAGGDLLNTIWSSLTNPVSHAFSGAGGNLNLPFGQGHAMGGEVQPGRVHRINELGGEFFEPKTPGRIYSLQEMQQMAAMGGGGGSGLTVHYHGPVATPWVASAVVNQLDRSSRVRDLRGLRGIA